LLFFETIEIPTAELTIIQKMADTACTNSNGCVEAKRLREKCFKPAKSWERDGVNYTLFLNNPAKDNVPSASDVNREQCFVVALHTLMALGLRPEEIKKSTALQSGLNNKIKRDPQFIAEMIKQSYKIKDDEKIKNKKLTFSVVKESSPVVFTLDTQASRDLAAAIGQPENKPTLGPLFTDDELKAFTKVSTNKDPIPLSDFHVSLEIRSFESLIYFLGEVVRAEVEIPRISPMSLPVTVRQRWLDAGASYETPLFVAKRDTPPADNARLVLEDDHGKTYWIPDICDASVIPSRPPGQCTTEYPNHQSMTVMTIFNQLWSLQKEPGTNPSPTIGVGG
jgi:hypothetical protein